MLGSTKGSGDMGAKINTVGGVKPRYDGEGSEFGALHRLLPAEAALTDIDDVVMVVDGEAVHFDDDELFLEYRVYPRVYGVALFEYKKARTPRTLKVLNSDDSQHKALLYFAKALRKYEELQGIRFYLPRLFVIFASNDKPPLDVHEIDTNNDTVQVVGRISYKRSVKGNTHVPDAKVAVCKCWWQLGLFSKN